MSDSFLGAGNAPSRERRRANCEFRKRYASLSRGSFPRPVYSWSTVRFLISIKSRGVKERSDRRGRQMRRIYTPRIYARTDISLRIIIGFSEAFSDGKRNLADTYSWSECRPDIEKFLELNYYNFIIITVLRRNEGSKEGRVRFEIKSEIKSFYFHKHKGEGELTRNTSAACEHI